MGKSGHKAATGELGATDLEIVQIGLCPKQATCSSDGGADRERQSSRVPVVVGKVTRSKGETGDDISDRMKKDATEEMLKAPRRPDVAPEFHSLELVQRYLFQTSMWPQFGMVEICPWQFQADSAGLTHHFHRDSTSTSFS
ncbi:hypothetical protein NEUTE1DRAFT_50955 [Neurospora tetrasperma FGSC 2508]|uniref:Uncharacterized protein n=1 Tax=Neurospora tetrasperma (strain FGSC 2508 / ATCC MYA-4615 / P0657) TaxID=510951 RepID=F8N388_NEUT8|nr:uncharacterized protein NEUTE1DRAFT_50955 [Neurospora tetrasperma FGSC 2508]EGO53395.1 hypothetical protein NEUTE1DRAFT_50955 [Neurospora tetrasperma FGSC 2508]